jgi:PAS domain S-box-containing protein
MSNDPLQSESFQYLADHVPAMLWRISADFRYDWANRSWFEFTGGTLDEERGFGWLEKVHPDDRQTLIDEIDRSFDAREPLLVEFRITGRDGRLRWVRDCGAPVFQDGEFDGFVGSCVDVTDVISATARLELVEETLESALDITRSERLQS